MEQRKRVYRLENCISGEARPHVCALAGGAWRHCCMADGQARLQVLTFGRVQLECCTGLQLLH